VATASTAARGGRTGPPGTSPAPASSSSRRTWAAGSTRPSRTPPGSTCSADCGLRLPTTPNGANTMADMNGQVALVTGGIRGIGLAICERLMNRGVHVAAGYSSHRDDAQQFADKYADHGVTIHQGNIGRNEDCERVIAEVLEQHGQLDVLVNN